MYPLDEAGHSEEEDGRPHQDHQGRRGGDGARGGGHHLQRRRPRRHHGPHQRRRRGLQVRGRMRRPPGGRPRGPRAGRAGGGGQGGGPRRNVPGQEGQVLARLLRGGSWKGQCQGWAVPGPPGWWSGAAGGHRGQERPGAHEQEEERIRNGQTVSSYLFKKNYYCVLTIIINVGWLIPTILTTATSWTSDKLPLRGYELSMSN